MSRIAKPISVIAGLSFLLLQSGGVHVHADAAGFIGAPETSYAHGPDRHSLHDEHVSAAPSREHPGSDHPAHGASGSVDDHGDVRDVSLLENALGTYKLPFAIIALVAVFAIFHRTRTPASAEIVYPVLSGRHTRWRPPLRAPPQPA